MWSLCVLSADPTPRQGMLSPWPLCGSYLNYRPRSWELGQPLHPVPRQFKYAREEEQRSLTLIPQWSLTSSLLIVYSPSFILSSLGFTAVAFVTGSLALWAPAFLLRSRVVLGETPPCLPGDSCSSSDRYLDGDWAGGPCRWQGMKWRGSVIQTQARRV